MEDLDYYASPGPMTDLTEVADVVAGCPSEPTAIAAVVQGLIMHPYWVDAYGVEVTAERGEDVHVRSAADIVRTIGSRDASPFVAAREPGGRFVGTCRTFSVLAVALLRRQGVPARARCGFASYFQPDRWVDHWVVEHWAGDRWRMLDAQIDELQRQATGLDDPTDLTTEQFLTGGEAWQACRSGELDGDHFGILDMWGQWFVAGNVARDLAALNKVEMLPWDAWGVVAGDDPPDDAVDAMASVLAGEARSALASAYADDPVTPMVFNVVRGVEETVGQVA